MRSAALKTDTTPLIAITKANPDAPAFVVTAPNILAIRAGTTIAVDGADHVFSDETVITLPELLPGADYQVYLLSDGTLLAAAYSADDAGQAVIGGFHHALGGNATARSGGDTTPAINPHSLWDTGFRPACADPRGMVLVTQNAHGDPIKPFWADIFLLNTDHVANGTSCAGAKIADGWSPPVKVDGSSERYGGLNWHQAKEIYAHHGKALLSDEDFRAAAFGTTEAKARRQEPEATGFDDPALDAQFTSIWGLMQSTGCMWTWGHDGDPDEPRAALLGGSWDAGANSGSRSSYWSYLPSVSSGNFGARGRCDHLTPA